MEAKSYTINFQVCGKRFRATVSANSRQEAETRIRAGIVDSIKVEDLDPLDKKIDAAFQKLEDAFERLGVFQNRFFQTLNKFTQK